MDRGTTAVRTFADAAARHRDLTERQLHVLRLVAAGRTNWEIGEALGITIDGAKWHVSELLTKLGFSSREELTGYWRWHNRPGARLGRTFRGLFALPAFKIAGAVAGAATLAGVAVVAWLAVGGTDKQVPQRVPPFELVAQVTVVDNSRTVGTNIGGSPAASSASEEHHSVVRWAFKDFTHSRFEIESVDPALYSRTLTGAISGDTMLIYDSLAHTYSKTPYQPPPGGWAMSPSFSLLFGPMPFDNPGAFMESLRQTRGKTAKQVTVVGRDTILGRDTTIIELSPAVTGGGSDGVERSSGNVRFWLDEERMFVMRTSSDGGDSGQSYTLEVTELAYAIPANRVDAGFVPPAGSKEVPSGLTGSGSSSASTPTGGRGSTLGLGGPGPAVMQGKPGFLAASQLPEGFAISGESSQSNSANELVSIRTDFTGRAPSVQGTTFLRIEQRTRADGLPAGLQTSDQTTVNGHPAYRGGNGAAKTLAWAQDGLAILITADALPYAELERIANSMTLQ